MAFPSVRMALPGLWLIVFICQAMLSQCLWIDVKSADELAIQNGVEVSEAIFKHFGTSPSTVYQIACLLEWYSELFLPIYNAIVEPENRQEWLGSLAEFNIFNTNLVNIGKANVNSTYEKILMESPAYKGPIRDSDLISLKNVTRFNYFVSSLVHEPNRLHSDFWQMSLFRRNLYPEPILGLLIILGSIGTIDGYAVMLSKMTIHNRELVVKRMVTYCEQNWMSLLRIANGLRLWVSEPDLAPHISYIMDSLKTNESIPRKTRTYDKVFAWAFCKTPEECRKHFKRLSVYLSRLLDSVKNSILDIRRISSLWIDHLLVGIRFFDVTNPEYNAVVSKELTRFFEHVDADEVPAFKVRNLLAAMAFGDVGIGIQSDFWHELYLPENMQSLQKTISMFIANFACLSPSIEMYIAAPPAVDGTILHFLDDLPTDIHLNLAFREPVLFQDQTFNFLIDLLRAYFRYHLEMGTYVMKMDDDVCWRPTMKFVELKIFLISIKYSLAWHYLKQDDFINTTYEKLAEFSDFPMNICGDDNMIPLVNVIKKELDPLVDRIGWNGLRFTLTEQPQYEQGISI